MLVSLSFLNNGLDVLYLFMKQRGKKPLSLPSAISLLCEVQGILPP